MAGRIWLALALATAIVAASPANAQGQRFAILRALDKVTARVSTVEAPVGETISFGTLRILVRTCRKRPPEEPPETSVFLEIRDIKPDEAPVRLFTGWMFSSSPALSALDHPVYDIWVLDCKTADGSPSPVNE
jgi:hypothetical protein